MIAIAGGPEKVKLCLELGAEHAIDQETDDIFDAVMTKELNPSWWLGLVAGILEIVLGFWASQQNFPARGALLLLWVGFFALFRGFSEIFIAFDLRSRQHV